MNFQEICSTWGCFHTLCWIFSVSFPSGSSRPSFLGHCFEVCLSPGKEVLVMEPINGSQVSSCFLYYFLFCLFTLFSVRAPKFYLPKPFHFQFLMLMLNSQMFLSFSVLFSSNSYFANKLFSLISLRIFSLYISI